MRSSLEHFQGERGVVFVLVIGKHSRRQKNIIGKRVAEARRKTRPVLTQDALSGRLARLGVQLDRAAVAKIENDHRRVLDYELKALALALDVDLEWLLGDEKR